MGIDLFAGLPVADYERAVAWYGRLLGSDPSFLPNETEAVWEVAEHRYLYIDVRPGHAGHAMHTLFVDDLDARVDAIAARGIEPADAGDLRERRAGRSPTGTPTGTRSVSAADPPDPGRSTPPTALPTA